MKEVNPTRTEKEKFVKDGKNEENFSFRDVSPREKRIH